MSEKGAHPTDDDIRQVQYTHLSHQDVVVDAIKRLGKVEKQCTQTGPYR